MKTSASRKYVTVDMIRRANSSLMSGDRSFVNSSLSSAVSLPSREDIVKAGNNAVERCLSKVKVIEHGAARRRQRVAPGGLTSIFTLAPHRGSSLSLRHNCTHPNVAILSGL